MDDTQFTKPLTLWYTLQETTLVNVTVMWALILIAGYAMWPVMCVTLLGAL
jgi:hypothetical protein